MVEYVGLDLKGAMLLALLCFCAGSAIYIEYKTKLPLKEIFNLPKELKNMKRTRIKRMEITDGTMIGATSNDDPVYIPDDAKHVFVCGTTGSGKTVALSNFIKRAIEKDYGLLIVDGKGDIGKNSILDITKQLSGDKKVYVINMNDPVNSDHYNPFQNANPTMVTDMLINMTSWSEEHYKENCISYLQKLVTLLELARIRLNFRNIVNYIPVAQYSVLCKTLAKANIITKEEHLEYMNTANTSGKIAENASARFSNITNGELRHILSETGIDIYTALCEKAIILFILNPLIYPELTQVFGRVILIDSKKAVSQLFNDEMRKFFIYDEIATYANKNFLDLVNKSRSANVTCILATQSLSDLNAISHDYKEQIIENCNNYIVLRQNSSVNAENWGKILGTQTTMKTTYQLVDKDMDISETNYGSVRQTREFLYHPDDIKALRTGKAVFMSKDNDYHAFIHVNKPF